MAIFFLLVLIFAVYIARKRSKHFIIKTILLAVLLAAVTILVFELINGPHAECGKDESVGPCDLPGRLWFDAPFALTLTFPVWVLIVVVNQAVLYLKQRFAKNMHKKSMTRT